MDTHYQVKAIGANGQISLGKEFAGKMVLIDQMDKDTWIIKTGTFLPDSEHWLHRGNGIAKLEKALAWSDKHAPQDNFDQLAKEIGND